MTDDVHLECCDGAVVVEGRDDAGELFRFDHPRRDVGMITLVADRASVTTSCVASLLATGA